MKRIAYLAYNTLQLSDTLLETESLARGVGPASRVRDAYINEKGSSNL